MKNDFAAAALTVALILSLAGCGSNSSGSGLTTASLLDGASARGDGPSISNEDPMARSIQVAWTAARAQKCGFHFDPARLRSAFLAAEQFRPDANPAQAEKAYDQTFQTISGQVAGRPDYCDDKRTAAIKADLNRHLAGDFAPNLPQPKPARPAGLFEALKGDEYDRKETTKFGSEEFWRDIEDRKHGRK